MDSEPRPMGNLDYHFLVPELDAALAGAWLNQAYDWPNGFRLKFHKEGELNLSVQPGVRMHLTASVSAAPATQTSFTKFLRKNMQNARVQSVQQLAFDRIVKINTPQKKPGGVCSLVFEQFGTGNVLALDANGSIIRPLAGKDYSQRSLHKGLAYKPPENPKLHPSQCTAESLKAGGKAGSGLVAAVAATVNLPPFYIEEACARCGLDLQLKADRLDGGQWEALAQEINAMPAYPKDPRAYFLDAMPYAASPFPLKKLAGTGGLQEQAHPTFSAALDAYYSPFWKQQLQTQAQAGESREAEKAKRTLEQQEKARVAFGLEERDCKLAGVWVYANLQEVDQLLEAARELRKLGRKAPEMQGELAGRAARLGMKVTVSQDRLTLGLSRE